LSNCCWLHCFEPIVGLDLTLLSSALSRRGFETLPLSPAKPAGPGVCVVRKASCELREFFLSLSHRGCERIIAVTGEQTPSNRGLGWDILQAGASDVLAFCDADQLAAQVAARLKRWLKVEELLNSKMVSDFIVAKSASWRAVLRGLIETARFGDATALILGETGTGKELAARLVHMLDSRPNAGDLVILDCSTIQPELSGSEFFGHERGAFTGASCERQGAFALAHGGTLFLDEIGELPPHLQAQLLRVIQEGVYKRVGGNVWRKSEFRLVCATNRDLAAQIRTGAFRADLYYRIAEYVCELPSLRERSEDVIPLAEYFLRQARPGGDAPQLSDAVREYLQRRDYPGNIRDLRQLVSRLLLSYSGGGVITIGDVPKSEWPAPEEDRNDWSDTEFERHVQRAVMLGASLKDISRAAEEAAIRVATREEGGNLQRAARRLGVTDRTLQLRRAGRVDGLRERASNSANGQSRATEEPRAMDRRG
jgi:transcriptional regulator with GAF, ATPase, and Fis domain